jgi:hypothetical protein
LHFGILDHRLRPWRLEFDNLVGLLCPESNFVLTKALKSHFGILDHRLRPWMLEFDNLVG